jgi:hypothetical protein
MNWLIVAAAAVLVYLHYTQNGSPSSTQLPPDLGDGRIPMVTSGGVGAYLGRDGTITNADGSTIGIVSSSGPRPGESGQIDMYDDSDP